MIKLKDDVNFEYLEKYGFIEDTANVELGDHYYSSNNYYYECNNPNFRITVSMISRGIDILHYSNEFGLDNTYRNDLDELYCLIKDGLVEIVNE